MRTNASDCTVLSMSMSACHSAIIKYVRPIFVCFDTEEYSNTKGRKEAMVLWRQRDTHISSIQVKDE